MTTHSQHIPCTGHHMSDFSRVKVDAAQTGFFRGREYRSFKELSIVTGATYVIKVVVPINTILQGLEIDADDGYLRMATVVGGVEGGVFSETLPIFNRNNMTVGPDREALVLPQLVVTAGGTHTGGTELDVFRIRTANASGGVSSVGKSAGDERGVAPNTYYFRFTNLGNTTILGTFHVRWEERG